MNRKAQTPPFSYKEMIAGLKQEFEEAKQAKQDRLDQQKLLERTKFSHVFTDYCEANNHKVSLKDERSYYRNWIGPNIGDKQLAEINLLDLKRIQKKMTEAGRAPRSIGYVKSIVRQVYNHAAEYGLYTGAPPTLHFFKNQKLNNKRERYLTPEEVDELLSTIRMHSEQCYRMTMLSLHTGMRFGEIAGLLWQHIDADEGIILVLDPKNDENRSVHMNEAIQEIFAGMEPGRPEALVFPSTKGTRMTDISDTFRRAVNKLGLNDGITDRRMKIVFHSLRHSCASWLANAGVEMQVIGKVLGHKTLAMTMRYSHINDTSVKDAMKTIEQQSKVKSKKKIINFPE